MSQFKNDTFFWNPRLTVGDEGKCYLIVPDLNERVEYIDLSVILYKNFFVFCFLSKVCNVRHVRTLGSVFPLFTLLGTLTRSIEGSQSKVRCHVQGTGLVSGRQYDTNSLCVSSPSSSVNPKHSVSRTLLSRRVSLLVFNTCRMPSHRKAEADS